MPEYYSIAAEQSVIGCCLRSAEHYDTACEILSEDDFYHLKEREIWSVISSLYEDSKTVDAVTVAAIIETDADEEGVLEYLMALAQEAAPRVKAYANVVRDFAKNRNLMDAGAQIIQISQSEIDLSEKLESSAAAISAVMDDSVEAGFVQMKKPAMQALDQLFERIENGGQIPGLQTGFKDIDEMTGGLMPADLCIIAGRPSQGKTLLSMNIAEHVAKTDPVLVFSLEMPAVGLANRMISSLGRIDFDAVKKGQLDDSDPRLMVACNELAKLQLYVDDRGGISIEQLRSRARVAAREHGCKLIIVDYLGMVRAEGERQDLRVGAVSTGLKNLAKELDVPVIAVCQLNRSVDSRTDKRPMMSDLRDSGSIEQDADLIGFVYLEEKYDPNTRMKGIGEFIIRKQRNGETGTCFLNFLGNYQRYETRDTALPAAPVNPKGGYY